MKKLHKLTITSFLGPFIATFFICLFILVMQFLWKYVDDLVGKGLEWYIISELLFYASASLVPMALPLAILLSSIMTFGSLAEHYELAAFKSAGVSLIRMMGPLIIFITILATAAFLFNNYLLPKANIKFAALLWDVRQQKPALDIKEGIFYTDIEGYSIRIGEKDEDGQGIHDILIYDHRERQGSNIVMRAEGGKMWMTADERWLMLNLQNGTRYEEMEPNQQQTPTHPHNQVHFEEYEMRFDLSAFTLTRTNEDLFRDNYQMLNIFELQHFQDSTASLVAGKRDIMPEYVKPYYKPMSDSIFQVETDAVATVGDDILPEMKPGAYRTVMERSLNFARTVEGILEVHAQEVSNFEEKRRRYVMEYHKKFILSAACLVLFFVGAPLGAIIRKGGIGMPAVASICIFIFYYVITIGMEKAAKNGSLEPMWGIWGPAVVVLPIGIFLTIKANQDSGLLSKEMWTKLFRTLNIFKKKPQQT